MANAYARPCGDFRTGYAADTTIFADAFSRRSVIVILVLLAFAPIAVQLGWLSKGWIDSFIEIGYLAVAALASTSWSASPARSRSAMPCSSASAPSPRPG